MRIVILIMLISAVSIYPQITFDPQGMYESTFNCEEWDSLNPVSPPCDDWDRQTTQYCGPSCGTQQYEQITAAANFEYGGGGRGMRHWIGCSGNDHSGGLYLTMPAGIHEFWLAWYFRFEHGFPHKFYQNKMLDWWFAGNPSLNHGVFNIPWWEDNLRYYSPTAGTIAAPDSTGWDWWFGDGNDADSSVWIYVEIHCVENTGGGNNGVLEMWIGKVDEGPTNVRKIIDRTDVAWTQFLQGWWRIMWGSNSVYGTSQAVNPPTRCMFYDVDDVSFSLNQRIGMKYYPSAGQPPTAPKNVKVTK